MTIKIRKSTEADLAGIRKVFLDSFSYPWRGEKKHITQSIKDGLSYVALDSQKIIGYMTYQFHPWQKTLYLTSIAVLKNYREASLGSKLLLKFVLAGKKRKIRRLFIDTGVDNVVAQRFYLKNGFKLEGSIKNWYHEGEEQVFLSRSV